jgi:uncharacterized membrane-anchored protein
MRRVIIIFYQLDETEKIGDNETFKIVRLIQSIIRDLVTALILIILNISILKFTNRTVKCRVANAPNINIISFTTTVLLKAKKVEKNKMKMFLIICFNYFFGHLPMFIYILTTFYKNSETFNSIATIILLVSVETPIITYCLYNYKFLDVLKFGNYPMTRHRSICNG